MLHSPKQDRIQPNLGEQTRRVEFFGHVNLTLAY
jgi:hypothetical protein